MILFCFFLIYLFVCLFVWDNAVLIGGEKLKYMSVVNKTGLNRELGSSQMAWLINQ